MRLSLKFRILFLLLMIVTSSLVSGCLSRRRAIPENERMLPAQTVSRTALFQELQEMSQSIRTMNARVTLDISAGSNKTGDALTEYRQTTGYILVERPGQIRVRAQAPLALATVFDMVSDGKQYSAWIPFKNKFFVGDTNAPPKPGNPVLNLRPQHIMNALFVDIRSHLANSQVRRMLEEATAGRNSYYIVQFIDVSSADVELVEKLWIDRSSMHIVRKQIFTRDGKVETDVEYSGYQMFGEVAFPQVMQIKRPIEDYSLKITFQRTALNEQLAADAFRLDKPAGAELVQLEPVVARF